MTLFRFWGQRLNRWREAARKEFLRNPDVVLFERGPEKASLIGEGMRGR
ncbi:hypothetical protein [Sphingobium sp.]|nr:hypothetical protein [Sphingobium sp.]HUD91815.1 hypothetical protein [Sphingobium sp.]